MTDKLVIALAQMTQTILRGKIKGLLPRWQDLKIAFGPMLRGSSIGAVFGPLPGLGGTISAFTSSSHACLSFGVL